MEMIDAVGFKRYRIPKGAILTTIQLSLREWYYLPSDGGERVGPYDNEKDALERAY